MCRTLSSSLAVCWPGTQSARDSYLLACNFDKYSPMLIFFSLADSAINCDYDASLFLEQGVVRPILSVHLCRTKLLRRSTLRGEIYKSRVWDKVPEGSRPIFGNTQLSLQHSVGHVEGSLHAKEPARSVQPFRYVGLIPTCDRQTPDDGEYRASIASRG